jgi:4-aminobutyrate aminotransferase-like enzyme
VHAELLKRDILAGTSGDPAVLRLLPPFTLGAAEVELLRSALLEIGA